jgi:hypothetical protein
MKNTNLTESEEAIIAKVFAGYETLSSVDIAAIDDSCYENMHVVLLTLQFHKRTFVKSKLLAAWLEKHGCYVYYFADEYYVTLDRPTMRELFDLGKTESFTIKSDNPDKPWIISCKKNVVVLNAKDIPDVWPWQIDGQYFNKTEWANNYMVKVVQEKLTGIRIIKHSRGTVPNLCGPEVYLLQHRSDGQGCHMMTENRRSNLCSNCPIAEMLDAERDGVKLVYKPEQES